MLSWSSILPETMCNFPRPPQALRRVVMMRARKLASTEAIITTSGGLHLSNTLLGHNLSILIHIVHNQLVLCVQYNVRVRAMGMCRAWR